MRTVTALTKVHITSFGFRHGPAPEAPVLLDVRRVLRDPLDVAELRKLTGLDRPIAEHVAATPGARRLVANTADLVAELLTDACDPRGELVRVAIGCAGGRHRSVALAELLAATLRRAGIGTDVDHRDIGRPVLLGAPERI